MEDSMIKTLECYKKGDITLDDAMDNMRKIVECVVLYFKKDNELMSEFIEHNFKSILETHDEKIRKSYLELLDKMMTMGDMRKDKGSQSKQNLICDD